MRVLSWVRGIFNQKLIAILFVLSIIPVLGFGMIMYVIGGKIVETEVSRSSQMAISQVRDQMDRLMGQIEKFSFQFSNQSNVIEFMKIGPSPSLGSMPQTNSLINDISNFVSTVPSIHSVYLYHASQQVVLGGAGGITHAPDGVLLDKGWIPALDEAAKARRSSVWITPRFLNEASGSSKLVVTYVKPLPYFYTEMEAALIVNIDAGYLADSIEEYPFGGQGKVLIFSTEGELIAQGGMLGHVSTADAATIFRNADRSERPTTPWFNMSGEEMFVHYEVSALNGWTYAMLIPADAPMRNVELLKRVVLYTTSVLCVAALVVALFSYNVFQRGIRRIGNLLFRDRNGEPSSGLSPVFSYERRIEDIEDQITELLEEVDDVKAEWQTQLPLLREQFLLSVLFGDLHGRSVAHSRVRPLFEEPFFSVLLVEMDDKTEGARFSSDDLRLFLFAVANIANELMKNQLVGETVLTSRHTAVLINLPEKSLEEEPVKLAEAIRIAVKTYLKQTVTIAAGRTVNLLQDAASSYNDAIKLLQTNWVKQGDEVLYYRKSAYPLNETFRYPSAIEQSLLEKMRAGDAEEACLELDHFAAELKQEGIALHLMKTYYVQLLVAIIRLLQEYDDDLSHVFTTQNPYADLAGLDSARMIEEWFKKGVIAPVISFIANLRRRRTKDMVERTKEFIRQHYVQDLSLQFVADFFEVSPSYLSQIFKKEMGETFINYVIRYRIERAKDLLNETELTIAKISEEVGYSNAQQLIRVFRKLEGMTPGEYREQNAKPSTR